MFPVFRSLSLRYLRLRWDRAALVVASIALGVATLVSTRILNQSLEAAAHDTMTPIPTANLYITNGDVGVLRQVADDVNRAKIAGVESASAILFEQIRLVGLGSPEGRVGLLVAADLDQLSNSKSTKAFTYRILDFGAVRSRTGVFISEFLWNERRTQGISDQTPVRLSYADRELEAPLAGVLEIDDQSKASSFQRNLVALDLNLALKLIKIEFPPIAAFVGSSLIGAFDTVRGDRVSRIDINMEPSADLERTRQAVQAVVGNRASVKTLEEQKKSTDDVIGGIQIGFTLCSAGALVVGLFLVYNALSVSVAERRHDIGILRSLGATRIQIARLFAGEAILLGIAGAVFGIPLGCYLADFAINMLKGDLDSMFLNPDIRPTRLSAWTMFAAMVAGVLTALLAALVPAIQAAHDQPADAVRRSPSAYSGLVRRLHLAACLLFIGAGLAMVLFRNALPPRTGSYVGIVLILIGMFLALPILIGWLAYLMLPLFRMFLGIEARLAADNLVRSPARTGVVIGALAAGVSLMIQTAGVGRSNEEPIKKWVEQVIQADAFVFSGSLTSANSSLAPMQPAVGEAMQKVDGVERVVGLRFMRPEYEGTVICMLAIDAQDYSRGTRARLPQGLPSLEAFDRLPEGDVIVVSDNFAARFKKKEGDVVTLPRRQGGPVNLTIIGVGQDYTWSKGTIFMDRKRFKEIFEDDFVDVFHVYFRDDADPIATRRHLEQAVVPWKLAVENRGFVKDFLAGVIDKIYKLAYLQQVLVAIVAALGVVTALLISVLQRRRELGLLRAVGATQWQVLKTVMAEAFLMGAIGTVLGIALGLPMEWYILRVVLFEESGFWFEMIIPWKEALGIGLVAIAVATIAGLIPALRAVQLRIVDAIAYE